MKDPRRRVLCVDDEPDVVRGLKLNLRKIAEVTTATSGAEGLASIEAEPPFALVISDMRMPEMNGATFLSRVRERSPDTVRVLLTGQTDLESAIQAVNEGQIFRFLTKPCPPETLASIVEAAFEQYALLQVERDLLERTLLGSVDVLSEVLGLVNPAAFSRVKRIQKTVSHACDELGLTQVWEFEVAALLSHLGCVAIPSELLAKSQGESPLDPKEVAIFQRHAEIGANLVGSIPRLEEAAAMIGGQFTAAPDDPPAMASEWERGALGAQILKVAAEFEIRERAAISGATALQKWRQEKSETPKFLLDALAGLEFESQAMTEATLSVAELRSGMVLAENASAKSGVILAASGTEVTATLIARLHNFAEGVGVEEPIRILAPSELLPKS